MMKRWRHCLLFYCLLGWPLASRASEVDHIFAGVGEIFKWLLALLAGAALLLLALVLLVRQLAKPEAAIRPHRAGYALGVGILAIPAVLLLFWGLALVFHPSELRTSPAWYYVPFGGSIALLLGLSAWLWRQRQRPTAAGALVGGLVASYCVALLVSGGRLPGYPPPVPLGLIGQPPFGEATFPLGRVAPDPRAAGKLYTYVEHMPGFQGAGTALKNIVSDELHYPDLARDKGLTGIVQVTFTIQTDGSVSDAKVTTPLSAECDEEALRVVQVLAPHFSPGIQNGRLVPVQEVLRFGFGPTPAAMQQEH